MTARDLTDTLLALEAQVWQALVSGDAVADDALLSDDFLGVYDDGFASKSAHVSQLSGGPTVAQFEISQARSRWLGEGHAMLSYRAQFRRTRSDAQEVMFVTSIWQREDGGWRNIFSQDTPAAPA